MTSRNDTAQVLQQAIAHFEEARSLIDPDKNPGLYGVILHDIAAANQAGGNLQQAITSYQESIIYKRKRLPDNPGDLATTMEAYSELLIDCGESTEVLTVLRQLTELLPQVPKAARAVHLHTLGIIFERLADSGQEEAYAEALTAYKEALGLVDPNADPGSYATVLNDMGDVYQEQGELEQARSAYAQAVDYMRRLPEEKRSLAGMLLDLGRIERRISNLAAKAESDNDEDQESPPSSEPGDRDGPEEAQ